MIEPDQASGTPFAYCKTYAMPYVTIRDIMYRVRVTGARQLGTRFAYCNNHARPQ